MAEKSIPVSVIMPVYNAGVYLKPALESLLEQTLKEIEIIAVDDGSTDGSGQLLAEYAARDKRLKVISLKRSGAAAARNRGIEAARGKWLWFADADDIAAPGLAEKMYRRGEETDSDMVICQANFLDVDGKKTLMKNTLVVNRLPPAEPFSLPDAGTFLFTNSAVWNKLYRRDFVIGKDIRFQNLSSCNDVAFGVLALAEAARICTVREALTTTASAFPATFRHRADAVPQTSSWRRVMCTTNSSGDISGNGSSTGFMRGSLIPSLMNTNKPPAAGRNTSCSNCLKLFCPKPSSSASSKTKRR